MKACHKYASAGTKVKVICIGQGQIQRLHFLKNGHFGGIRVSQTHLGFFLLEKICTVDESVDLR